MWGSLESCDSVPLSPGLDCGIYAGESDGEGEDMEDVVGKIPKLRKAPREPSAQERRDHEQLHLPYRSWCRWCVKARGASHPHVKQAEVNHGMAGINLDYWFMRNEAGEDKATVLTLKDDESKAYCGYVCVKKGRSDDLGWKIVNDVARMGHGKESIVVKSDNENSISDLVNEIVELRSSETHVETSPKYDSQSNGIAERAIRSHEGLCRTIKLALEDHIGGRIDCSHPIITFLVPHTADLLTKIMIGKDGRTAYERIKKKKYSGELVEFGCGVHCLVPVDKLEGGNMTERWVEGCWVGKRWNSDEHKVILEDGNIHYFRSVEILDEKRRWRKDLIDWVKCTPWKKFKIESAGSDEPKVIPFTPLEVKESVEYKPVIPDYSTRSFRITDDMIHKFGYIKGCIRCEAMRRKAFDVNSKRHSAQCRERLIKVMKEDEHFVRVVVDSEVRSQEFNNRRQEDITKERDEMLNQNQESGNRNQESNVDSQGKSASSEMSEELRKELDEKEKRKSCEEEEGETEGKKKRRRLGEELKEEEKEGEEKGTSSSSTNGGKANVEIEKRSLGEESADVGQAKRRRTDVTMILHLDNRTNLDEALKKVRQKRPQTCVVNISGNDHCEKRVAVQICLEQVQHKRSFVVEGIGSEYVWQDTELHRLLSKCDTFESHLDVGCTRDNRGKIKLITNNCIIHDRIERIKRIRGICICREYVESAIFESGEIEVVGRRADLETRYLSLCELHDDVEINWSYIDDITGLELNPKLVEKARAE